MIWYFLAGFISGAVGMVMFAHHWVHKRMTVIKVPLENKEENKND